jgi:serine/threonine protein kinase
MLLTTGARLGSYEIIGALGAGGMGEVYRARDLNLQREVAIKVLPALFVEDPERLGRFEREARALASLNHPNIATIHGLERANGATFLIMELVSGETLADRIARGRLPLDEALPLALQIAAALEAAHEKGIVHRDLKPANIAVTSEGKVKVLDFGLAKALGDEIPPAEVSHSPTMSFGGTRAGVILGTAAYMSPEQARGKAVDKRTDIWAFGCVLYEMLSGKPAFGGETVTDIVAAVVQNEPDWQALPPNTPAAVRSLVRRSLKKDPSQRLHDISDARIEIQEAMAEPVPATLAPLPEGITRRSRWMRPLPGPSSC